MSIAVFDTSTKCVFNTLKFEHVETGQASGK